MHGNGTGDTGIEAAIQAHEKYVLGVAGGRRADLKFLRAPAIDLSARRLDDIELSGAYLAEANFSGASLTRASLNCANIMRANLSGANLWHVDLRGARIQGANFEFADMDGADFRQASIAMIDPNGKWTAPGTEKGPAFVSFANCSLRGAKLNNANLKNAKFDGAMLNEVSFAGATLDNATFEGAVLVGVNLKEMRVQPARLRNCIIDPRPESHSRLSRCLAMLDEAQTWARTEGREGSPASFEGEDIRLLARHMKERALTGINLARTIAVNTDFSGCELQAAKFDGADLRGANFGGADLRGASFAGANLSHANFTKANLLPLVLEKGGKIATSFEGAALDRANFADAQGRRASDLRRGALLEV
ncbi:MAG TPA: pentapeptide repeat-containing protein [Rhizomicrobium sp.]|nr:pentapeptide repeat-containing protein [Rhizomicrobium sp.]